MQSGRQDAESHGCALLVIDVQNELFHKGTPIYRAEEVIASVNDLIDRAHAAGVPVVEVQHSADRNLVYGSHGWEIHPAVHRDAGDLPLHKRHGNAFEDTQLQATLEERGVHELVVCGLVTHGCVRATCLGARNLGYHVTLAGDAHSSYSADAAGLIKEWNAKLAQAGVEVKSTSDIAFA